MRRSKCAEVKISQPRQNRRGFLCQTSCLWCSLIGPAAEGNQKSRRSPCSILSASELGIDKRVTMAP